jgi:hypothetical protein
MVIRKDVQTCIGVQVYIRVDNERIVSADTYRDRYTVTWLSDQRARLVSTSSTGDVRSRG